METARYGGKIGDDLYYRVYGKYFDRGPFSIPPVRQRPWHQGRFGFRTDWDLDRDKSNNLDCPGRLLCGRVGYDSHSYATVPPFSWLESGTPTTPGKRAGPLAAR